MFGFLRSFFRSTKRKTACNSKESSQASPSGISDLLRHSCPECKSGPSYIDTAHDTGEARYICRSCDATWLVPLTPPSSVSPDTPPKLDSDEEESEEENVSLSMRVSKKVTRMSLSGKEQVVKTYSEITNRDSTIELWEPEDMTQEMADFLTTCQDLKALRFFTGSDCDIFFPALHQIPKLETLQLSVTHITKKQAEVLTNCESLESLSLSGLNNIEYILPSLINLPNLRELSFSHVKLTKELIYLLADIPKLDSLGLDDVTGVTRGIFSGLKNCVKLQEISVTQSWCGDDQLIDILSINSLRRMLFSPTGRGLGKLTSEGLSKLSESRLRYGEITLPRNTVDSYRPGFKVALETFLTNISVSFDSVFGEVGSYHTYILKGDNFQFLLKQLQKGEASSNSSPKLRDTVASNAKTSAPKKEKRIKRVRLTLSELRDRIYSRGRDPDLTYVNLSHRDLRGYELDGLDLSYSNFSGSNLSSFVDTYLRYEYDEDEHEEEIEEEVEIETTFRRTKLVNAVLKDTDLSNSDLSYVNLEGANLRGADLSNTNLTGANLTDADLTFAFLLGATCNGVNFTGATFGGAMLCPDEDWLEDEDGSFEPVFFQDAIFERAWLQDVDFGESYLSGANFKRADLTGANLSQAKIAGNDVEEDIVTANAILKNTLFPKSYRPDLSDEELINKLIDSLD